MMESAPRQALFRYRVVLGFFILALVASGATAIPLQTELSILTKVVRSPASLHAWIEHVDTGLRETYARYPFFAYGTDWLAFGHFVIALFFVLPFINPIKYRAVLKIGLVACAGVALVAFILGPIRGIPIFWRLIDCSFGIVGAIPILYCLRLTRAIESQSQQPSRS